MNPLHILKNQFEILTLLRKIKVEKSRSILSVFHDPFLAFSFLDGYIFIKDGEIKEYGNKDKIFTSENLKELYEFDFFTPMLYNDELKNM